ncbi:MAG: acetylxylan esterase [Acidobacteria bacterium]|nr:acetylxylan esterase [Acidobacteriota bacterium]
MKRITSFPSAIIIGASCLFATGTLPRADSSEQARDRVIEQLRIARKHYEIGADFTRRTEALRVGLLRGLHLWPVPQGGPPRTIVHSRRDYPEYAVENVAVESLPGFYCTGNLYRPLGRSGSRPAILLPDGHFRPLGRLRDEHQILAAHLARMGAVVFAYSMVGWDDSVQTSHTDPLVPALQTWNSIRALDYLSSMEEVDPTLIGVAGASGGGTQAIYLTIADRRVRVCAAIVIVYPWSWFSPSCLCETGMGLMRAPGTNMVELAASIAPRPLLLVSCGRNAGAVDPTSTFPEDGWPFISSAYRAAGARMDVHSLHLGDEGHDYGPSKRAATYAFFVEQLGLDPMAEDLGAIRLEAPGDLMVFESDHPLPPYAVCGVEETATAFKSLIARTDHRR